MSARRYLDSRSGRQADASAGVACGSSGAPDGLEFSSGDGLLERSLEFDLADHPAADVGLEVEADVLLGPAVAFPTTTTTAGGDTP